jgi:hypothetical protein
MFHEKDIHMWIRFILAEKQRGDIVNVFIKIKLENQNNLKFYKRADLIILMINGLYLQS